MTNKISLFPTTPSDSFTPNESADFIEIENYINHAIAYSLGGEIHTDNIRELVQQYYTSPLELKDIVSTIVIAILSRRELHDEKIKNESLEDIISQLSFKTHSIKNEIAILNKHESTLEVDLNGKILMVNDLMLETSGFSREELIGSNMQIMSSGKHSKKFWNNFWTTIKSGRIWAGDICNKKKDGSIFWLWTLVIPKNDERGLPISFKVIRQDISESIEVKKMMDEIREQKNDHLTGLPNHTKCLENHSLGKNRSIALLHVNNLFDINSVFGRARGDKVIKLIAKALSRFERENNVNIYKFEGTDFGIVFNEAVTEKDILANYERLHELEIIDGTKRIHLSFSLGIVLDEPNIETLLRNGYLALKQSKQMRKPIIFDNKSHSDRESKDFFEMRTLVKEAFKKNLFEVHFQEIIDNRSCSGKQGNRKYECLVRMYDSGEKTNLISPGRFLPVIKKDGENHLLTTCVIEKVCQFMQENEGDFSINLTEEDLQTYNFAECILAKIQAFNIDPRRITFEILEEIENIDSKNILENIQAMKKLGFQIAIDDFGSGYSNFSRMLDFEPNYIKIDMSYVRGVNINQKHRSLIKAIVGLAHDNNMLVVGEGVETEKEQLVLESLGVDYSQGYLFSKPGPNIISP